ncbi:glycerophosphodiester phosphodiesterase family protein [Luteolibacter sp. Populi]|uniref:glycerophosphodiester phosphodiesterase family protein n=1 Tax=Luteolibacter sp. Populi TaxID=3230487 RepID=UPI0034656E4B
MNSRGDTAAMGMAYWLTITTVSLAGENIAGILARFHDSEDPRVLVAAHRGGYFSDDGAILPENSIPAIERSIAAGAEILEIDLRSTSDGHLVIMHDATVTRTTNGSGAVSSMTLAQVKALRLLGPNGAATSQQVPTFAEVMALVKGRAMVNLDKLDATHPTSLAAALQVLRDTGTLDHALFKGSAPAEAVKAVLQSHAEEIHYMPVLTDTSAQAVLSVLETLRPPAIELIFTNASTPMLDPAVLGKARETGTRIWINSLWSDLNGGHDDALAIGGDPDASWGWIVSKGGSILQTDYPVELATYLHRLGRRDEPAPVSTVDYDFRDGTLQGWSNIRNSVVGASAFVVDEGIYGDRTPATRGIYKVVHTPFLAGRDGYHSTLILRSPGFRLHGLRNYQAITFSLLGGAGGVGSVPASDLLLSDAAEPTGFLGMALRRGSDGAYLLSARRSSAGQGHAWQRVVWDAGTLAPALESDAADETYTLDLIDAFGPQVQTGTVSWGWIALDAVAIPWTGSGDPTLPAIKTFGFDPMVLEWTSYPGFSYRVYRSSDPGASGWTPASVDLLATPPLNRFAIPANPLSPAREFFRVERGDPAE